MKKHIAVILCVALCGCANGVLTPQGQVAINALTNIALEAANQYAGGGKVDTHQLAANGIYGAQALVAAYAAAHSGQVPPAILATAAGTQYPAIGQAISKAIGATAPSKALVDTLGAAALKAGG